VNVSRIIKEHDKNDKQALLTPVGYYGEINEKYCLALNPLYASMFCLVLARKRLQSGEEGKRNIQINMSNILLMIILARFEPTLSNLQNKLAELDLKIMERNKMLLFISRCS
jgi:hypothetical protein